MCFGGDFIKTRLVSIGDEVIGGDAVVMMAGPCAVEGEEQIMQIAKAVQAAGATFLRGGAYKARTSPYAFSGLGATGLKLLRRAADAYKLKVVSEITSERQLDEILQCCDMAQVGARNMQNFELLKVLGQAKIPVLLKRAPGATIDEWLNAAEYVLAGGNSNVVLCERGIRTFETQTRYTLDISAIPVLKAKTDLPVVVDPSHAAGYSGYVKALSLAALSAGADGLLIEVHNAPNLALSDSRQQISLDEYKKLHLEAKKVTNAVGRKI